MSEAQDLVERYRGAFTRGDVGALVDCFAFPLQVVSATDGRAAVSVASREEWPRVLERILRAYGRLGVTACVPLAVETIEELDAVVVVRVRWALRREGGEPVYDFAALYTLGRVEGRLRIVALVHDEVPRMLAALERPAGR